MDAGELIYQGLSSVGSGIERRFDRQRQQAEQAAKQAEQAEKEAKERSQRFSKLVTALDTMQWMPKDVAMTKSLEELEGFTQGKEVLGKLGEAELSNKLKSLQAAALERQAEYEQSFEQAVGQATQPLRMASPGLIPQINPVGGAQPITSTRLLEAMGQNPRAFQSRLGGALAERALAAQMEGGPAPYQPEQFEVGGMKGIVSPRTGSIHVTPLVEAQQEAQQQIFANKVKLMTMEQAERRKTAIQTALSKSTKYNPIDPEIAAMLKAELDVINKKLSGEAAPSGQRTPITINPKDPLGLFGQ